MVPAGENSPRTGRRATGSNLPHELSPQLAILTLEPPASDDWLHEIKYDGYRLLARINGENVHLLTRNGNDWTSRFPAISLALRDLQLDSAWLDGEVVALSRDGRSSFAALQQQLSTSDDSGLTYVLFDLLYLNGKSWLRTPLAKRKRALADVMSRQGNSAVLRYSDHVQGNGRAFYEQVCRHGLEGMISKRSDQPYRSERSKDWRKIKCEQRQEFVAGGFTESAASDRLFGALLLGVFERGRFVYAGRVGTGFNRRNSARLYAELQESEVNRCPFVRCPPTEARERVHWVRPEVVVEVRFSNWTADGVLRHASFQARREDKLAAQIQRETPLPVNLGTTRAKPAARSGPIAGRKLSNADKVLYPELTLSKAGLAAYYEAVAPVMLPFMANRPLTLVRCPDGYQAECFFQKHISGAFPAGIETVEVEHDRGMVRYPVVRSVDGLLSLVQLGTLEVHTWGARADRLDRPDLITFDLDPGPQVDWTSIVQAALLLRTLLEGLGLKGFVKMTGGKGLHVAVPIVRRWGWDEVKAFAKAVALHLVRFDPHKFSATLTRAGRENKILIDYLRNGRGATAIVPYSTRARPGAPVAAPITWQLLERGIRAGEFTVIDRDALLEIAATDPWREFQASAVCLTRSMRAALERR